MPKYRLIDADGEPLGEASYATEIHLGDVIHWPQTQRLRVTAVGYDAADEVEVLTVAPAA